MVPFIYRRIIIVITIVVIGSIETIESSKNQAITTIPISSPLSSSLPATSSSSSSSSSEIVYVTASIDGESSQSAEFPSHVLSDNDQQIEALRKKIAIFTVQRASITQSNLGRAINSTGRKDNVVDSYSVYDHIFTSAAAIGNEFGRLLISNVRDSITTGGSNNEFELKLLHAEFLTKLQSLYFQMYLEGAEATTEKMRTKRPKRGEAKCPSFEGELQSQKRVILSSCKAAMLAATPESKRNGWRFEGLMRELELDIDSTLQVYIARQEGQSHPTPEETDEDDKVEVSAKGLGRVNVFLSRLLRRFFRFRLWGGKTVSGEPTYTETSLSRRWIKRLKWFAIQSVLLGFNYFQNEMQRKMSYRAAEKRLAEVPGLPLL